MSSLQIAREQARAFDVTMHSLKIQLQNMEEISNEALENDDVELWAGAQEEISRLEALMFDEVIVMRAEQQEEAATWMVDSIDESEWYDEAPRRRKGKIQLKKQPRIDRKRTKVSPIHHGYTRAEAQGWGDE